MIRPMLKASQALRHADAAEDVLDQGRVDVGVALEQLVDDEGAHLLGAQRASEPLKARPIGVRTVSTITASGIRCSPWIPGVKWFVRERS